MVTGKARQKLSEWWHVGKENLSLLMANKKHLSDNNLLGLVINPQHVKLLKINRSADQYEVAFLSVVDLPEGLVVNTDVKDCAALAEILKNIFDHSDVNTRNIALAIPRSSAIVKTITVDSRLNPEEIESRVWLEANRLFPNLIGEIYLDFVVSGPSSQDSSQLEVLIVACRKEQINPYLDVMRMAGLNAKVVDINYYAYGRSLYLLNKQLPQLKTIALLNISFKLIDLIVTSDGSLVYTHELSYDGRDLLKFTRKFNSSQDKTSGDESTQATLNNEQFVEILKNTIGLHLKHAMQFFYSSRPNTRIERIVLSGDAVAALPSILDYVRQEVGKEVVLAEPFSNMKIADNVDKSMLEHYAPAMMLCCGLALTTLV